MNIRSSLYWCRYSIQAGLENVTVSQNILNKYLEDFFFTLQSKAVSHFAEVWTVDIGNILIPFFHFCHHQIKENYFYRVQKYKFLLIFGPAGSKPAILTPRPCRWPETSATVLWAFWTIKKEISDTRHWTQACWVRASYPNHQIIPD